MNKLIVLLAIICAVLVSYFIYEVKTFKQQQCEPPPVFKLVDSTKVDIIVVWQKIEDGAYNFSFPTGGMQARFKNCYLLRSVIYKGKQTPIYDITSGSIGELHESFTEIIMPENRAIILGGNTQEYSLTVEEDTGFGVLLRKISVDEDLLKESLAHVPSP